MTKGYWIFKLLCQHLLCEKTGVPGYRLGIQKRFESKVKIELRNAEMESTRSDDCETHECG